MSRFCLHWFQSKRKNTTSGVCLCYGYTSPQRSPSRTLVTGNVFFSALLLTISISRILFHVSPLHFFSFIIRMCGQLCFLSVLRKHLAASKKIIHGFRLARGFLAASYTARSPCFGTQFSRNDSFCARYSRPEQILLKGSRRCILVVYLSRFYSNIVPHRIHHHSGPSYHNVMRVSVRHLW